MSEPEPSPDLRKDVLHPFPVPQLIEDDDLVVSELIAVRFIYHDVSPSSMDTRRASETKNAQPIAMDRLGRVVVCGGDGCSMSLWTEEFTAFPKPSKADLKARVNGEFLWGHFACH